MSLNRWQPAGPAWGYKTYALLAPVATHRRKATCAEAGCPHYLRGWSTTVAAGSADEALIRRTCYERRYLHTVERLPGGFVRFDFAQGQPCFRAGSHTVTLERDPICVVRGGDWRGNPTGWRMTHAGVADWADDFATHVDRIWSRLR